MAKAVPPLEVTTLCACPILADSPELRTLPSQGCSWIILMHWITLQSYNP